MPLSELEWQRIPNMLEFSSYLKFSDSKVMDEQEGQRVNDSNNSSSPDRNTQQDIKAYRRSNNFLDVTADYGEFCH